MVTNFLDELIESIRMAKYEAIKHDIETNAVMLTDELYHTYFHNDLGMAKYDVHMICGLKAIPSCGILPEGTAFAVFHGTNLPLSMEEELSKLRQENEELRAFKELIRSILEAN